MTENILTTALRGFANAFGLRGERTGPPGVDLSLGAQTIADLTPFALYGAARSDPNNRGDGWWTFGQDLGSAVQFAFTTLDPLGVADYPGRVSDTFWIYSVGVTSLLSGGGAFADFVAMQLQLTYPTGFDWGPGQNRVPPIYHAGAVEPISAVGGFCVPSTNPARVPWPMTPGCTIGAALSLIAIPAGTTTANISILGRILPRGVPPMPY